MRARLLAQFKAVLNLAAALSVLSTSSLAASISLLLLDNDPAHAIVGVEGDLVSGDDVQFRTQVGRLTKAIVAFNSNGGNLLAGISIGKTIRLKSFATAVLDGQTCASACAIAWLGGSRRFMSPTAHIGFHAAYTEKAGRASESGVGNALVGSYLAQIGLPETAVVYITQAAPSGLTLLTLRDAEKIGIEVSLFQQQRRVPKTTPPVTSRETPKQETSTRARLFIKEMHSRFSQSNAIGWLGPLYADEVIVYGKLIPRHEVIRLHGLLTERWPERGYNILDKSMNAVCGDVPPVECTVTGTMEMAARNLARNSAVSMLDRFT